MIDLSYSKLDRLRKSSDYSYLSKNGNKYFSKYFIVIARDNVICRSRLGVTVSKKVGKAWVRNKIKRVVREYFRLHVKETIKCKDVNVIARKGLVELNSSDIFDTLRKAFDRVISKEVL